MVDWVVLWLILDLCAMETGYEVRGKGPGATVKTGGSREKSEGNGRRDFGGGKGAAAMGIWQAWQERGRV